MALRTTTPVATAPVAADAPAPSRSALILAFASIYLIWGSTYLGMRVTIESMPPFAMAGTRFLLAGSLLFAFLRFRGAAWPTARQWRINGVIGSFLLLGGNGLVVWAQQFLPSGVAALIIGVQPLFFVLTEWAWPGGTRPTVLMMAALLLGFSGIAWLAAPWEKANTGGLYVPAVVAVLTACVCWAIGSIYSRHAKHGTDPLMAAATQMLTGGALLVAMSWARGDFATLQVSAITARSWLAFAYLVCAGSLIGFSTFVWLMKHASPARVATYAYVNPIVAVFLGWLLLGEPVTSRTVVACTIVVAAVALITTLKTRRSS